MATGIVLILISGAPVVIGMARGFDQLKRGDPPTAVDSGVSMAFHPAFIACGAIGLLLVIIGIARAILGRCGRPTA
jgi:hypothetical protein